MTAQPAMPSPNAMPDDSPFNRDKFLFKQRLLSINEKYDVIDEDGSTLFYVERPAKVLMNILALLAAIATFICIVVLSIFLAKAADKLVRDSGVFVFIAGVPLAFAGTVVVAAWLAPKRHVGLFADQSKTIPLLRVRQDFKLAILNARYTVLQPDGAPLAIVSKNLLTDLFRKNWKVLSPDGVLIAEGLEDSWLYAMLRRFGGTMAALFRTNFIFQRPDGTLLGKFNRKLTLLDRYVLDMTPDPGVTFDRRLAVALAVMLDTAERR